MTIEKTITKAIEGGWLKGKGKEITFGRGEIIIDYGDGTTGIYTYEKIFLDPSFWQSLGKAMGWFEVTMKVDPPKEKTLTIQKPNSTMWKVHWHRFIDHLAEGKSPEDYFKNL